jgi:hypothetical protein
MRKGLPGVICALVAVILLLFPPLFYCDGSNALIRQWLNGGKISYRGKLIVAVVDAGASGKDAIEQWILDRAAAYEKRYFGIFVEVSAMTLSEAEERIGNGDTPDVLLCGSDADKGLLERAVPFESTGVDGALPQLNGGLLTPVFQSGVVVLVNEDALYKYGLSPPAGMETMDDAWVEGTLCAMPQAFAYEDAASLMAVVQSRLPDAAQYAMVTGKRLEVEAFFRGDAAIFAGTPRALWELYRMELLGKPAPCVIPYALMGFAPHVQYAMLMQNADAARKEAAAAFISSLLGKAAQRALADIYALPVISDVECTRDDLGFLWQNAGQVLLAYPGYGEAEFLRLIQTGASLASLRQWVQTLCLPP